MTTIAVWTGLGSSKMVWITFSAAGRMSSPNRGDYLGCTWLPPKWDWVDPLKDARAEIEQIEAGLKSPTQALSERP